MVARSGAALLQAAQLWWLRDDVQQFQRRYFGTPWATLLLLCASLLALAAVTGGLPATRQLFDAHSRANTEELYISWHPGASGDDRPLPSDVVPAWAHDSRLLTGVAPFVISREHAFSPVLNGPGPLVIKTEASLFPVLNLQAAAGQFPAPAQAGQWKLEAPSESASLVIDYPTAQLISPLNGKVIGSRLRVGKNWFRVAAVLPRSFRFLTRQPIVFLVEHLMPETNVMVVAHIKPGATKAAIDRELVRIAEDKTYYFFASQLRLRFQRDAILLPLSIFGMGTLGSALLTLAVCGIRMRDTKRNWTGTRSRWALRRIAYFAVKTALGLFFVFMAGLELCRLPSSILLGSRDPANGPFLLWLYIAGSMAVFFLSVADGRRRCRNCLRLLVSPVRVGSPGCLLLDWSGTELICSEGHGVLHVPHMTTSWEAEAQHWITMDDSWQDLFAAGKKHR